MVSVSGDGYLTLSNILPQMTIEQFRLFARNPHNIHRGNGVDGNYYAEHDGDRKYDVWWTKQPPMEMWLPIVRMLTPQIDMFFDGPWAVHCVDCITTRPHSSKLYAHIDTPYRFEEFAAVDRTLGVQIIIPLDDFTLENGATAFLPSSHQMMIDFRDLEENRQEYNELLVTHGQQFVSNAGDVLMYDGRTLHSTMPNNSDRYRSALLINVLLEEILPRVKELDKNTDFVAIDSMDWL
jgi:hypothetical protein